MNLLEKTEAIGSSFLNMVKLIPYRNIIGSHIDKPNLIHPKAKIKDSNLFGEIIVEEGALIENVHINGGTVKIGRYSTVNGPNSDIYCKKNPVVIGNFSSIARNVSIQEYDHITDRVTTYFILNHIFGEEWETETISKGSIIIGNDVWIGTQSCILSGVNIGTGSVIGANSVVISNIPPFSIAAGCPAKVIKPRFSKEIIKKLEEMEWWNWKIETIKNNRSFFTGTLTMEKFDKLKL